MNIVGSITMLDDADESKVPTTWQNISCQIKYTWNFIAGFIILCSTVSKSF